MEEGTVIYSRELFDPTDVNDFRNRRVLIDLQEKTPSISFYIAKEDAYIASLTGIIKSNRTKFLLIVPNKRVMKVSKLFLYRILLLVLFISLICVVCRLSKMSFRPTINHLPMHKNIFYAFIHLNLIYESQFTFIN